MLFVYDADSPCLGRVSRLALRREPAAAQVVADADAVVEALRHDEEGHAEGQPSTL